MTRKLLSRGGQRALWNRVPRLWRERLALVGQLAAEQGGAACLVGGSVRDLMLGQTPLDWDVVLEGAAGEVVREAAARLAARVVSHPVFLTHALEFSDGTFLDVATARRETYRQAAALPAVAPARLEDDFARRDFTVNAMALRLAPDAWGALVDPFGGARDLRKGVVRVLHDQSFRDDPTRLYRAARYAGRYGWRVAPGTAALIRVAVRRKFPALLSPARRRNELLRILEEKDPRPALRLLWTWGVWPFWSPSWRWTRDLARLWPAPGSDPAAYGLMALAATGPQDRAETDLRGLEVPRAVIDNVMSALEIRAALVSNRPPETLPSRLSESAERFLRRSVKEGAVWKRWARASPALTGGDLQELGYPPGPLYKDIFDAVRRARWEGRVRTRQDEVRLLVDNFPRKK